MATNYLTDAETRLEKSFYPIKYKSYVTDACNKYDLDKALVYAVIKTESGFDEDAQSNVGARGLMQIMPDTFEWLQKLKNETYETSDLFDAEVNIDYGCYYLRFLLDMYDNESTAIAAYNAGQSMVSDWLKNNDYSNDGITLESIPYGETSNYVQKVEDTKEMYIKLYFS